MEQFVEDCGAVPDVLITEQSSCDVLFEQPEYVISGSVVSIGPLGPHSILVSEVISSHLLHMPTDRKVGHLQFPVEQVKFG